MLGPTAGLRCLDLGSDNGVVSLLLRERGRRLGLGRPDRGGGGLDPLAGGRGRPPGRAATACPSRTRPSTAWSWWTCSSTCPTRRPSRRAGARDEAGRPPRRQHARTSSARCCGGCATPSARPTRSTATCGPATRRSACASCSRPAFALERHRTYSRFFSEAVDTAINWGMERLGKKSSAKGMVVTGDDVARHRKAVPRLLRDLPVGVGGDAASTRSCPASGYMLIATLERRRG